MELFRGYLGDTRVKQLSLPAVIATAANRGGLARLARRCALLALFGACGDSGAPPDRVDPETGRWYAAGQVAAGAAIFAEHCAVCHGDAAQGIVADWRARLPDGSFPPPPLNGSAHAWHHPIPVLLQVIGKGGEPLGGRMPAFEQVLDEDQQLAAIAWFQDFWSDEIYRQWLVTGGAN